MTSTSQRAARGVVEPFHSGAANPAAVSDSAAPSAAGVPPIYDATAADQADAGPGEAEGGAGDGATGPAETNLPADRFGNRELSWLDFNARVLALAEDPAQPLLERVKFLAIFASNLDEFYMVRVAGLKRRSDMGLAVVSSDGLTISEQLEKVSERTQELVERLGSCFTDEVLPALDAVGIRLVHWDDIEPGDRADLAGYFSDQIFPVLTPLAVDPGHPFPYISGLSLNMAIVVRDPHTGTERFARLKVPKNVDRFIRVRRGVDDFLPIEDLIAAHLGELFPGMQVAEHQTFRVTRNADFEVDEDRDEDLLQALERELARRRFGPPVRLEIADTTSERIVKLLIDELDVDPGDVVEVPGLLDLSSLWQIYGLDRPSLKDAPFVPSTPPAFAEGETPKSAFAYLRDGDVLLHHPYESFATTVQRFIEQAAADPQVLAIKQTLYRTSGDSPIVDALISAASAGKQVVVLVEIKARFDEQANISWAKALERAGVHVVYGLVGLKTHCKIALVVRQEGSTIRRYCHIGTGNYNPKTARMYEDVGLLTAAPEIGADLTDLFNSLTGYSRKTSYRNLLVAPYGVRRGIIERIDNEIAHKLAGREAGIRLKANALVDEQVIDALYRASKAGIPVEIVVRGICALKPGVPGLSENIEVRSILGRFLEHSRMFHFRSADEFWIGSADMMHRNLDRRVEVMVQVKDPKLSKQLGDIFDSALDPRTRCWVLHPDGSWVAAPERGEDVREHQQSLMRSRTASGS